MINIVNEAGRCLQCKKPMCMDGCPVHTNIPEIIGMFKENRVMEAGRELFENNPMSVVCAIVCNHEAQCTGHCVLGRKGNPVRFYKLSNISQIRIWTEWILSVPKRRIIEQP